MIKAVRVGGSAQDRLVLAADEEGKLSHPPAAVSAPVLAGEGDGQDVKAGDTVEVPQIGCSDAPSGSYGGRSDDPVVCPDVLAGSDESGPDAGVRTSGEQAEGQRGESGQDSLDEGLTARPVLRGSAVYSVQQLGGGDGGDPDLLVRPQLLLQARAHLRHGACRRQAPDGAFKLDEDCSV